MHAQDQPGWIPDRWHSSPPSEPPLGSVRFEVGLDDVKLVVGACLTDILLGSNPVFELASSWHRFLPDPDTLWRLWLYVLAHYLASGWNLAPLHLRKVSQLVGGHFHTSQLLERPRQWLANPYGHPEKCRPKPLRTHLRIGRIPLCCTRRNVLRAFSTPLHVDNTWIHESATSLWTVQDPSGATANPEHLHRSDGETASKYILCWKHACFYASWKTTTMGRV